jgi:dGTP triphosphohydrolase
MAMKKRRRFMKIELLETSAVGTPAYADAHFSFFKSLSTAYNQQLKGGHNTEKMAEEVTTEKEAVVQEVKSEAQVEVKSEVVEAVKEVVVEEVKATEVKTTEAVVETKSDKMDELIATLKEVIAKMPVERALIETKSSQVDKVKSASNGELFLAMLQKK